MASHSIDRGAAASCQRATVRLGAWNGLTRELVAATNTTVVNTETICELLRKFAASGLTGPITVVQGPATRSGITLLCLPSFSPNLNLIERLWKFIKPRA